MIETDRAVSTTVGYALALSITTILVSGLLISTGNVVDSREKMTTRNELEVVGERVVAGLMSADRLATTEGASDVAVSVTLPTTVAGNRYSIEIGTTKVIIEADSVRTSVTVPVDTSTTLSTGTVSGGSIRIVLDGGDLEVQSA
jgi:hypothetical protein